MDSRREFLRKTALLAAGTGVAGTFPPAIRRAFAIDPAPGTTYLDAEHVVILMQENRSFDHLYGTLRGVRGFNDPRAVTLPDGNPVWLQSNAHGETYVPFRLDLKDTRATWMSSLPHTWVDQTDARNDGRHDRWLDAKRSGRAEYAELPLTLGFYTREDLPFYYALADAFTVCDQAFCSSLTGTTPNRLYLWTGTIRDRPSILAKANVFNEDVVYDREVSWTTFPERLQDHGISWRIYQNEIGLDTGLTAEADAWLANFRDNPIEWFTQYRVRASAAFRRNLPGKQAALAEEIARLEASPAPRPDRVERRLQSLRRDLQTVRRDLADWTDASVARLTTREKDLHARAFTTNEGDSDYHQLASLTYRDGAQERRMVVPKGDVLHQFRRDVESGTLPTVSWIVAPENFSDHPSAPWYGAWYLSEAFDILTKNADVWRKTIFILCYDENDGYFDHVPPFVPPYPGRPETGAVSAGIDPSVEHVRWEQEEERLRRHPNAQGRAGPIGLGFRVPLVIASPWTRGGYACSQVFDHTSVIQFLERLLTHRTGRRLRETNISAWRRTVCGDLTSAFRAGEETRLAPPTPVERDRFLSSIHEAQFKPIPNGFKQLTTDETAAARDNPDSVAWMPRQEPGVRPSCALPYELTVHGSLSADRHAFVIEFSAGKDAFGERAAGAPFHVYAPARTRGGVSARGRQPSSAMTTGRSWAYAVAAGERLAGTWSLADFETGEYTLRVHGPNGFFRSFVGSADDPLLEIRAEPERQGRELTGNLTLHLRSRDAARALVAVIEDLSYGAPPRTVTLGRSGADARGRIVVLASRSAGWHDVRVRVQGAPRFEQRYAGRVETGKAGSSDPHMGRGRA